MKGTMPQGLGGGCRTLVGHVDVMPDLADAGTTKRGIGPAYASKATRNGIRVGDLRNMDDFADKLRKLAWDGSKRFEGWQYDVEADIAKYAELREKACPLTHALLLTVLHAVMHI